MHDITCNRDVHPPIGSRGLDSVQTTGEKTTCLHDATSANDHDDKLDGQSENKEILERTGLPSMEEFLVD